MAKVKKMSRREFARTSVAASAGALGLDTVLSTSASTAEAGAAVTTPTAETGFSGGKEVAVAQLGRRRRVPMPVEVAYGGWSADGRDVLLQDTLTPADQTARSYPGGWRDGTTIPADYYIEEKHFLNDERFIADHFWLIADHESRIPKPGDYFVFEYGRGNSVIIVRDRQGEIKGHHNVCRHRGSRLCQHELDNIRPSESGPDGKSQVVGLSVVQLGPSGNTPVFRCPYHAWTYDLDGKLISVPPGMPNGFELLQHGLHAAHVRTVEGFIFVSFAQHEPPEFDSWVANWRAVGKEYGTVGLKVVARRHYPFNANWKLTVENFRECYHCGPAHKSLVKVFYYADGLMSAAQRERIERELTRHGHPVAGASYAEMLSVADDKLIETRGVGATGSEGRHLSPGFVTVSLDGKPVAPLLPTKKEWTHLTRTVSTGFSTSFLGGYDDHCVAARFTPRGVMRTDVEFMWLVRADAGEKDVDLERMTTVWDRTIREDRWLCENNHHGLMNGRYSGGQPYSGTEGGPAGFIKWYMTEVAPRATAG